ncbi:MAG: hypothetical protein M5F18_10710 [Asgard group archaeon]|nr:hypothetical protein JTP64_000264 [Candida tropicalis]MCP8719744.1 hypothetical protein [Asgard group archaeon]
MFRRFLSQTTKSNFQKNAIKKMIPQQPAARSVVINKWAPSHGNSFRTFAEYRLKVSNVSPLAIAQKRHNHN